jgi:hypothetical protein
MRLLALALVTACAPSTSLNAPGGDSSTPWLQEGAQCMVCHERVTTKAGEDVSFGSLWRASIMANSARDPYWQAAVRREIADHAPAQVAIEDECSRCHMPMANEHARAAGKKGEVFSNLDNPLAIDGVACSLCHQISAAKLGKPESYSGGFVIQPRGWPQIYGPYDLEEKQSSLMRSALGVVPVRGDHIRSSELCATCHMLYTHTLDSQGQEVGTFPEQVPYLEWQQSAFANRQSCQDCHMPRVSGPQAISSVAPAPRDSLARHDFRGANFFMLAMLDRYRGVLAVTAPPATLELARTTTETFLQQATARVTIASVTRDGTRLTADVLVENLGGHKLPTAYPSRRAWLHVVVSDANGRTVFESGRLQTDGSIAGNDNDLDPHKFEHHHTEIRNADEVQIYEPILGTQHDEVTTGLLSTTHYLKDNRLLPLGFDKTKAHPDTAVHGEAAEDADFIGGRDRVRYALDVGNTAGPLRVEAELLYQPIGFRWAHNLDAYPAPEPKRFVTFYDEMSTGTATRLAGAAATVP